jgi:hypothetical protein
MPGDLPMLPACDLCARCIDREIAVTCVVERDLTDPANVAYVRRRRTELLADRRRLGDEQARMATPNTEAP